MDERKVLDGIRKVGDVWIERDARDGMLHRYTLVNTSYMIDERYLQTAVRVVDLGVVEESNGQH